MGASPKMRARVPHDLCEEVADLAGVTPTVARKIIFAYHRAIYADLFDGRPVEITGVGTLRVMLRRVTKSKRNIPTTAGLVPRCRFRPTTSMSHKLEYVQDAAERYPLGDSASRVDAIFDSAHAGELDEDDPRLRPMGD